MTEAAGRLSRAGSAMAEAAARSSSADLLRVNRLTGGAALLAMLIGWVLSTLLTRGIEGPLRKAVEEMATGAHQLADAVSHISSASQALAQGASEQAATLEETSSAGTEVASLVSANADHSQHAAGAMDRALGLSRQAEQELALTLSAMHGITDSSGKISKIIKTIDEISFQTNILALNAAVEAARAGEAGLGFAVVADEVRNLAQRCARAASETAELIEESISRSREGAAKVDLVAESVRAFTVTATDAKAFVDQVESGGRQQAHGVEQVASSLSQIQQVTQATAAHAEQSAAAAEELTAQAETLRSVGVTLETMIGARTS